MPRCIRKFRGFARPTPSLQDGLDLLNQRLCTLALELPRVHVMTPAEWEHLTTGWHSMLSRRLDDGASDRCIAEATQALSASWTVLNAWRHFELPLPSCSPAPGNRSCAKAASIHFLGASRAECTMPQAIFRDLVDVLGTVNVLLVGPAACPPSLPMMETGRVEDTGLKINVAAMKYEECHAAAPTLAVALNAGLQESAGTSWLPAMRQLLSTRVPTVFTGYNREDVVAGLACLLANGLHPNIRFAGSNAFGSMLGAVPIAQIRQARPIHSCPNETIAVLHEARDLAASLEPKDLDQPIPRLGKHPHRRALRRALRTSRWDSCQLFDTAPPLCNSYWVGFWGETQPERHIVL